MNNVDRSIAIIREFAPRDKPLYVAFSGGKDSIVLLDLIRRAGVPHTATYNNTTIDPPELARFLREHYPDVSWSTPKRPFFVALLSQGYPTRKHRWCCRELKEERVPDGIPMIATGVRAAESAKRARRQMIESCYKRPGVRYLHPILDWTDEDVWNYIRERGLAYCSLYDEGWKRIGCVFCPQAPDAERIEQATRWPKMVEAYRRAFNRLYQKRITSSRAGPSWKFWTSGDELFDWWLYRKEPASRALERIEAEAAARNDSRREAEETDESLVEAIRIFWNDDAD